MKYSWKRARSWTFDVCRSIENNWTCPSRKLATGVPVLVTPGRSLPMALNVNDPVGDGGWMTFSRSHRQSRPILNVWRPFSHVSESATWEPPGVKPGAVCGGEPSCVRPQMRKVGRVSGNFAEEGMPGMLRAAPADADNCAAVRPTLRRVSPMRTSFNTLDENMCW